MAQGHLCRDNRLECEVCIRGKMTRKIFPKDSKRKSESLDLVHIDLCGPKRCESEGTAKYYLEFQVVPSTIYKIQK